MGNMPKIPDDLVKAYLDLQTKAIKYRLSEDDDYHEAVKGDQKK
jgi:hypothetical protein